MGEWPTAAIDYLLAAGWKSRGIRPAAVCDDQVFVRRVYVDLAGRIPTREEVEEFFHDSKSQKRARLVDRLFASDDYSRAFREIWDALLMGRHTGRREQQRRDNGWFAFLEDVFRKNRPWNEVVRDMIMARPESPEAKGAVWFVFERRTSISRLLKPWRRSSTAPGSIALSVTIIRWRAKSNRVTTGVSLPP